MGRYDELQLIVTRGRSQTTTAESAATTSATRSEEQQRSLLPTDVFESVTTSESTSELSPAERLVQEFHSAWSGNGTRTCSPGELVAAKECLAVYGFERATQLLPRVVKRMREQFPDAKIFRKGATRQYFADVQAEHEKRERIAESAKQAHLAEVLEAEKARSEEQQLEARWLSLPRAEQETLRQSVLLKNPRLRLERHPVLWHRFCLDALRRHSNVA